MPQKNTKTPLPYKEMAELWFANRDKLERASGTPVLDKSGAFTGDFYYPSIDKREDQPNPERLRQFLANYEAQTGAPVPLVAGQPITAFDPVDPYESQGFWDSAANIGMLAWNESLGGLGIATAGKLATGESGFGTFDLSHWQPSKFESVMGSIVSFLNPFDAGIMVLGGGIGTSILKGAMKEAAEKMAAKLVASGVKDVTSEMVVGALAKEAQGISAKLAYRALPGATALGTYEGIRGTFTDMYEKGEFGESALVAGAMGALKGAVTGAAAGAGGLLREPFKGRWLERPAGLIGEGVAFATAGAAMEGRIPEFNDFKDATAFLIGMKIAHPLMRYSEALARTTGGAVGKGQLPSIDNYREAFRKATDEAKLGMRQLAGDIASYMEDAARSGVAVQDAVTAAAKRFKSMYEEQGYLPEYVRDKRAAQAAEYQQWRQQQFAETQRRMQETGEVVSNQGEEITRTEIANRAGDVAPYSRFEPTEGFEPAYPFELSPLFGPKEVGQKPSEVFDYRDREGNKIMPYEEPAAEPSAEAPVEALGKQEPMYFEMPPGDNIYGWFTNTIKLIREDKRTSTTRFRWRNGQPKVGDIIDFAGNGEKVRVRVTGVETVTADDAVNPEWIKEWSKSEGWTEEWWNRQNGKYVGATRVRYERVGEKRYEISPKGEQEFNRDHGVPQHLRQLADEQRARSRVLKLRQALDRWSKTVPKYREVSTEVLEKYQQEMVDAAAKEGVFYDEERGLFYTTDERTAARFESAPMEVRPEEGAKIKQMWRVDMPVPEKFFSRLETDLNGIVDKAFDQFQGAVVKVNYASGRNVASPAERQLGGEIIPAFLKLAKDLGSGKEVARVLSRVLRQVKEPIERWHALRDAMMTNEIEKILLWASETGRKADALELIHRYPTLLKMKEHYKGWKDRAADIKVMEAALRNAKDEPLSKDQTKLVQKYIDLSHKLASLEAQWSNAKSEAEERQYEERMNRLTSELSLLQQRFDYETDATQGRSERFREMLQTRIEAENNREEYYRLKREVGGKMEWNAKKGVLRRAFEGQPFAQKPAVLDFRNENLIFGKDDIGMLWGRPRIHSERTMKRPVFAFTNPILFPEAEPMDAITKKYKNVWYDDTVPGIGVIDKIFGELFSGHQVTVRTHKDLGINLKQGQVVELKDGDKVVKVLVVKATPARQDKNVLRPDEHGDMKPQSFRRFVLAPLDAIGKVGVPDRYRVQTAMVTQMTPKQRLNLRTILEKKTSYSVKELVELLGDDFVKGLRVMNPALDQFESLQLIGQQFGKRGFNLPETVDTPGNLFEFNGVAVVGKVTTKAGKPVYSLIDIMLPEWLPNDHAVEVAAAEMYAKVMEEAIDGGGNIYIQKNFMYLRPELFGFLSGADFLGEMTSRGNWRVKRPEEIPFDFGRELNGTVNASTEGRKAQIKAGRLLDVLRNEMTNAGVEATEIERQLKALKSLYERDREWKGELKGADDATLADYYDKFAEYLEDVYRGKMDSKPEYQEQPEYGNAKLGKWHDTEVDIEEGTPGAGDRALKEFGDSDIARYSRLVKTVKPLIERLRTRKDSPLVGLAQAKKDGKSVLLNPYLVAQRLARRFGIGYLSRMSLYDHTANYLGWAGKRAGGSRSIDGIAVNPDYSNDWGVNTHEIGHGIIRKVLGWTPEKDPEQIDLMKFKGELENWRNENEQIDLDEQFARYFVDYMINEVHSNPRELAPQLTAFMEERLQQYDAGKHIAEFKESYDLYRQVTEENPLKIPQTRIVPQKQGKLDDTPLGKRITDWLKHHADGQIGLKDVFVELLGKEVYEKIPVNQRPYEFYRAMAGSPTAASHAAMSGVPVTFDYEGNIKFRNEVKSVTQIFKELTGGGRNPERIGDWISWMMAKTSEHWQSKKEKHFVGGRPEDTKKILEFAAKQPYIKQFEQAARDMHEFMGVLRNQLEIAGLDKRLLKRLEEDNFFYLPLFTMEEPVFSDPIYRTGIGAKTSKAVVKNVEFSDVNMENPLKNLQTFVDSVYNFSLKQMVFDKFTKLTEDHKAEGTDPSLSMYMEFLGNRDNNPNLMPDIEKLLGDFATELGERPGFGYLKELMANAEDREALAHFMTVVWHGSANLPKAGDVMPIMVWDADAKKRRLELLRVHDPSLLQALVTTYDPEAATLYKKLLSSPVRMIRWGAITVNPAFWMRAGARGGQGTLIMSKYKTTFGNDVKMMFEGWKDAFGYALSGDQKKYADIAEMEAMGICESTFQAHREMRQGKFDTRSLKSKPSNALEVLQSIQDWMQKIGTAVEMGPRVAEYRKALKKSGSHTEAALAARDVDTDFLRSSAQTKALNLAIPFYNPAVQGLYRTAEVLNDPKLRKLAVLRATIGITLPTMLMFLLNKDEDWYKELSAQEKALWLHFKLPGTKEIVRVPRPFDWGMVFGGIPEGMMNAIHEKDPKAFSDIARSSLSELTPIPIDPTSLMNTGFQAVGSVAAIRPFIEWGANYSFWQDRPLVNYFTGQKPPELQFYDTTPLAYRALGYATGTAPIKMQNLIEGTTGGVARFPARMIDYAINPMLDSEQSQKKAQLWSKTDLGQSGLQKVSTFFPFVMPQRSPESLKKSRELRYKEGVLKLKESKKYGLIDAGEYREELAKLRERYR